MKTLSQHITESFVNESMQTIVDKLDVIIDLKKRMKFLDTLNDTQIQTLFQKLYPKENPNQSVKEKMEKIAGL